MSDETLLSKASRLAKETEGDAVDKRRHGSSFKTEKDRGLNPALVLGPAAANAFDAYATREMLKAGHREANPIVAPFADNAPALYGTKIGTGLLIGFLANKLAKAGHPTAAKIVSSVSIALPVGAGVHNLNLASKGKK